MDHGNVNPEESNSTQGSDRQIYQKLMEALRYHATTYADEGLGLIQQAREDAEKRLLEVKKFYEDGLDNLKRKMEEILATLNAQPDRNIQTRQTSVSASEIAQRPAVVVEKNLPQISSRPGKTAIRPKFQKGDNKLTTEIEYNLWKHRIRHELLSQDCLFLIDKQEQPSETLDERDICLMKSAVISYLLSNLDEKYQRHVRHATGPAEIMAGLDNVCERTSSFSESHYRTAIENLRYDPRYPVMDFLIEFDDLVEKIRKCPDASLSDAQVKHHLLTAFAEALPEVVGGVRREKRPGSTISDIKVMLLGEEEMLKDLHRRSNFSASTSQGHALYVKNTFNTRKRPYLDTQRLDKDRSFHQPATKTSKRLPTCRKCGIQGHQGDKCRKFGRVCYNCGKDDGHLSVDCPEVPTESTRRYRLRAEQNVTARQNKKVGKNRRRISVKAAIAESKRRAKEGKTFLAIFADPENERLPDSDHMCWVEDLESDDDFEQAMFAHCRNDESGSTDVAYSAVDRKSRRNPYLHFIIDTGSTEHIVNNRDVFVNLRTLPKPKFIVCANKNSQADLVIYQVGDIIFKNEDSNTYGCLQNVLYAPDLSENLFSLRKQMKNNLNAVFSDRTVELRDRSNGELVKSGVYDGRFWWIVFSLPCINVSALQRNHIVQEVFKHLGISCLADSEIGGSAESVSSSTSPVVPEGGSKENLPALLPTSKRPRDESESSKDRVYNSGEYNCGLPSQQSKAVSSIRDNLGLLWHYRLNHASKRYLETAAKFIPCLKKIKFESDILDCSSCKMAKAKRKPCKDIRIRSDIPFHRMWSDLMGPIKPYSHKTLNKYVVTFTDDATRFVFAFEIPDKTKVHVALNECILEIRKIKGPEAKLVQILTDGGTEYRTSEMRILLTRENITLTACEPATPQHNACSERLNWTLASDIRVNLISAGMPTNFWGYALRHSVHIHNRTPNSSNNFLTPYELVHGKPPNLEYIRRFGCEAYVLDNHAKTKGKFDSRANLCFLLECSDTGYVLLDAKKNTIVRSKNVDFIESKVYGDHSEKPVNHEGTLDLHLKNDTSGVEKMDEEHSEVDESRISEEPSSSDPQKKKWIGETSEYDFYEELEKDNDDDEAAFLSFSEHPYFEENPQTYWDAINSEQSEFWIQAVNTEFDALTKCDTWEVVPKISLPSNTRVVKSRWVHRIKFEADGKTRYRSRLVAKGFSDSNYYDQTETYAPVARLADVRFLLIIANKFDLELTQYDVKTAFLNGTLEKSVYMEIPEGYCQYLGQSEKFKKDNVCKLKRALYGLKVSPKRWFIKFQETMDKMGFQPYDFQPCLFLWRNKDDFAILLLYVDDILLVTNNQIKQKETEHLLRQEFEISSLGEPTQFLGLEIKRNRQKRHIFLHQSKFIKSLINRFDVTHLKTVQVPMRPGDERRNSKTKTERTVNHPFRQAIGSLLFLQNGTRPDITFATNVLSRRQSDYTDYDWELVLRILRYLAGSMDYGLMFSGKEDNSIKCYSDASLGLNDEKGNSTTGYVITIFGDLVTWRTKKQNHVALSSAECEYVAMSVACRELANIRTMSRIILKLNITPLVLEDNRSAIRLAETEDSTTFKHLTKLCYHYVRNEVKNNNIIIRWLDTNRQLADVFTKPLPRNKFLLFRNILVAQQPE